MEKRVDVTALKVNQSFIVGLTVLAFILGTGMGGQWLILAVAIVMAVGTAIPDAGLFKQFYARVLRPLGILKPRVIPDDPVPHLFAQGVGSACLFIAFILLSVGLPIAGWFFSWLVTALALVNLTIGFCAGCFMYYQLGRLGLLPRAIRSSNRP